MGAVQIAEASYDKLAPFLTVMLERRPIEDFTSAEAIKALYAICHFDAQGKNSKFEEGF